MKEKAFENKLKKIIDDAGGWEVKFFANGFTKKGIPDILACINGIFLGIEVKGDGGRPSELQKYHLKQIQNAGGIGIIVYPENLETFVVMIEELSSIGDTAIYKTVDKWNRTFHPWGLK